MYPYSAMASAQDQTTGDILIYDVVTPVPIQSVGTGTLVKVVGADAKVAGLVLVEFDGNRRGRMNLSQLTNLAKPRSTTPTEIKIVEAAKTPEITSEIERQLKEEMAESDLAPLTPQKPQPEGGGAMLIAGLVLAGLVMMQ
jgi:hypothetical protein